MDAEPVRELNADDWVILGALVRHVRRNQFEEFMAQGAGCAWCRRPIRLKGRVSAEVDGRRRQIFNSSSLPDGVILKACGTRRQSLCPSCAWIYRGDARQLIMAGLVGGKGTSESVNQSPAVLMTLTAPSFGFVHRSQDAGVCRTSGARLCSHRRPTSCLLRHRGDDPAVGTPLCPDCYEYQSAVVFNATVPELWRRTTIYVGRHLAGVLGVPQSRLSQSVRLSFVRVAELQRRGAVHLHAVIRADTPDLAFRTSR